MSAISLQSLQTQIRKDPQSYKEDFLMQYRHFESISDSLHLNPGRPSKQYGDLLHFVSHCYPCYPALHGDLGLETLIHKTLAKEPERLHQTVRRSLVQSALLLRSKGAMQFLRNFERLFILNSIEDKDVRKLLFNGLLGDIGNSTVPNKRLPKGENSAVNRKAVQGYLISVLRNSSSSVGLVRAAAGLLLAAFKKKLWRDSSVANAIADAVILGQEVDSKTTIAGVYLLLGNYKQAMRISDACEEFDNKSEQLKKKKKTGDEDDDDEIEMEKANKMIDFTAIDLLNDSQSFVEKLYARVQKKQLPFEQRILLIQLIARLVGRHELVLLNFYPFVNSFLRPNNPGVTKILAAFTEASHPLVPPEDLQATINHILQFFVADHCRPEAIALGINTLRVMAARAPLALNSEQVHYLCDFKDSKNRTVVGASRAILNLFREKFPELLPRKLRGKDAAMSVSAGTATRPEYGHKDAPLADLPGIRRLREEDDVCDADHSDEDEDEEVEDGDDEEDAEDDSEEDEGDDDEDEEEEEDEDEESVTDAEEEADESTSQQKISIAAERVLDDDDFRRMRKKRKADEMESSGEETDEDSDGGFQAIDPDSLAPKRRNLTTMTKKQARVATITEGKTDKSMFKKKDRRGGSTNKEKTRNKPIMMTTQKRKSKKSLMSATDKARHLKKHIKNLRKKVGGVQKRRRN